MDVQLVLEVSGIATVISAGMSYLTFRKSSNLTYITNERKEWRDSIRKIADELEKSSYKEREQVLVRLKTRINAYGEESKDKVKDAHIWKLIKEIEKCKKNEYDRLKKKMIFYLSVLLKYDWERSKKEVSGNALQFMGRIFAIVAFILLTVGSIKGYKTPYVFMIVLLLLWATIMVSICWKSERISEKPSKKIAYISFFVLLVGILASFFFVACAIKKLVKDQDGYILAAFVAFYLFISLQVLVEFQKMMDNIFYRDFIQQYDINENKENEKYEKS